MAFDALTAPTFAALTLDAPALKKALALAGHVIPKRNGIPVLGAVRLTAHPGALTIAATDLDMSLHITIAADTADHGQAVFPLPVLAGPVAKVKGKASLVFDGADLILDAGGATVTSGEGFPLADYPDLTPALYQERATIPAPVLLSALAPVLPCMSSEETRYYLRGVFFHGHRARATDAASLRLVATDGHRLGVYDLPSPWPAESAGDDRGGLILPTDAAEMLARLLKESGDAEITISTDHRHGTRFAFSGPNWTLESKAVDGRFPDYTRVFPSGDVAATYMLAASDLPPAPRGRLALAVKLDADAGRMSWADGATVAGRDVLAEGAGAIGFNARYLADFAKVAPDGLTIEAFDSGAPARVKTSDPRFVGLLMPMRV